MSVSLPGNFWKPITIAAALGFVYASVLAKLGHDWWTDENYSHGLLIPFIIGFILWSEREHLRRAAQRPSVWWGVAAIVCALMALWIGTAGAELYAQRLSLVLMLAAIVLYFWGFKLLRMALVPLALLLLAIPIPAIVFNKIAFPLQLFASRCAVWAMRVFDIPVLRQGNVIELMPLGAKETKKLEVVEACSGIRSLMTLVTLAVVFAYFTHPSEGGTDDKNGEGSGRGWLSQLKRYSFWRSLIIVLSAVPIAILTNAMRVSGTGVLSRYYGTKVADGFFHSFSGWVIYIVAFLLLFAVGWVLDRAGSLGHQDKQKREQSSAASPAPEMKNESEENVPVAETPAAISGSKEGSVSV
ncbi:MAG TPA: exosortase [Pyrinomonadaceae bacterium]|jgi:exosortase|nr:exosortase [Pyrinomonadaceae bacterium]